MAAQKAPEPQAAPRKRGKLVIIVSVIVLVLGAGGGAAWFFMRPADAEAAAVAEAKPKPAVFLPLESFTVNLMPSAGQPEFVQAGLTLKFDDAHTSELVKQRMPEVRNRILMVLSSKRGPDLLPASGKQKLADEIAQAVKGIIDPVKPAAPKVAVEEKAADDPSASEESKTADAKAAETKAAKKAAADKATKVEVLFTAFIIQ
jgi:flagellar FliL protein